MKTDSFGARSMLSTAQGDLVIYRLGTLERTGVTRGLDRLPFSIKVVLEAVLRNVDGELVTDRGREAARAWNGGGAARHGAALHARARDPAGLHGCPGPWWTSPRCAAPSSSWVTTAQDQPARASRSRGGPFGAGGRVRLAGRRSEERAIEFERNRERYEFLRWGQKAFCQLPCRAARDGHRAPGEPGVPGQGRPDTEAQRPDARLPGHAGRHRLAHDHVSTGWVFSAGASAGSRPRP